MAARRKLTDRLLNSLRPAPVGRVEIYDSIVPPLMVRVTATGHKSFALYTRVKGPPVRLALGDYGAVTLEQARKKARAWLEMVAQGKDPREEEARETERRRREEERRTAGCFSAVVEEFSRRHLSQNKRGAETQRALERELLPLWGPRPIGEISRRDIIAALDRVVDRGASVAANRLLSAIKKLFAWSVERGYLDSSPAALVKRPTKELARDRVLSDAEIAAIWHACGRLGRAEAEGGLVSPFGAAVRFLLATAARRDEAKDLVWAELDLDHKVWRLPRARSKGDTAREIPLSDLAVRTLESVPRFGGPDAYVFSTHTRGNRPLGGWSREKARLDEESGVTGWRLHDLRRSAATGMAKLGIERLVISRVLGHVEGGITSIYDRHAYGPEQARALARWAATIERTVAAAPAGETVVALRPSAG